MTVKQGLALAAAYALALLFMGGAILVAKDAHTQMTELNEARSDGNKLAAVAYALQQELSRKAALERECSEQACPDFDPTPAEESAYQPVLITGRCWCVLQIGRPVSP